jgi:hypothetical protein
MIDLLGKNLEMNMGAYPEQITWPYLDELHQKWNFMSS